MWPFKRKRITPETQAFISRAYSVKTKVLYNNPECGISFQVPPQPDYEGLSKHQIEVLSGYQTFSPRATGLFIPQTMSMYSKHLAEIEEAYKRYKEALEHTYSDQIKQLETNAKQRLMQISGQERKTTVNQKEGK